MLAFGRLPRGTLSTLRNIWIGDEELQFDVMGKGIAEYLLHLKQRLESVEAFATDRANKKQNAVC